MRPLRLSASAFAFALALVLAFPSPALAAGGGLEPVHFLLLLPIAIALGVGVVASAWPFVRRRAPSRPLAAAGFVGAVAWATAWALPVIAVIVHDQVRPRWPGLVDLVAGRGPVPEAVVSAALLLTWIAAPAVAGALALRWRSGVWPGFTGAASVGLATAALQVAAVAAWLAGLG